MHFDFPHYRAYNSGLKDEASQETWRVYGSAKFSSNLEPAEADYPPRFGYRCLYTQNTSGHIYATNSYGTFTITPTDKVSFEAFIKVLSTQTGGIFTLSDGNNPILELKLNDSRCLALSCTAWGLGINDTDAVSLDGWHHVRFSLSSSTAEIWLDGVKVASQSVTGTSTLSPAMFEIGGCNALFDEFCMKRDTLDSAVPSSPYRGTLDITKAGGFGNGKDGDFSCTSGTLSINTAGNVISASGVSMTVYSWSQANYFKTITPGDEIMFLVTASRHVSGPYDYLGLYAFRHVISADGLNFTIDYPVEEEFPLTAQTARDYVVRAYKIPNFKTFSFSGINAREHGEVFAFRCQGNATWGGGFYCQTSSYRDDDFDLCHSDLPDRMIPSYGNILVFCGGTFSAPQGARIGLPLSVKNIFRPAGYGASSGYDMPVMIGSQSSHYHEANILIAARRLSIDDSALCYGARSAGHYSGLCYLAGDMS